MNRWKRYALALGLALGIGSFGAEYVLVDNGRSDAVIVIGPNPTTAAQLAAHELADAVREIAGVRLPTSGKRVPGKLNLVIGNPDGAAADNQYGPQEYELRFEPDAIIFAGRDDTPRQKLFYDPAQPWTWRPLPSIFSEHGPLDAVYDFLERDCGVRFLNPTEFGTHYPKRSRLTASGKNLRRKPFMEYRETSLRPRNYDVSNIIFREKTPEFLEYARIAYPALADQPRFLNDARERMGLRHMLRSRLGGKMVRCNHSMEPYGKIFSRTKPQYLARVSGGEIPQQYCYNNDELVDQVASEARNYFADKDIFGNPMKNRRWGAHNFAVVPRDNEFHCACPACRSRLRPGVYRGTSSNLIFHFANRVAEKIAVSNPGETVSVLAYSGYRKPPEFPLADNIAVHFCWDPNRRPEWDAENQRTERDLAAWVERAPKRGLYLWMYNTFPVEYADNNGWYCFPAFFARQAARQYRLCAKIGIRGVFHCGWGQEVDSYVSAKMMVDPTLDPEVLIRDFFVSSFGPAARPMQQFYDLVESTYLDRNNYPAGFQGPQTLAIAYGRLGTPERMKRLESYIADAEKRADASPYRERVALWKHGIWRYMQKGAAQYREKMAQPVPAFTVPRVADASGDPARIDWSRAVGSDKFYRPNSGEPAARKLVYKLAHDGKFLYIRLEDPCRTDRLLVSPGVFAVDVWELFFGRELGGATRQLAFNPEGKTVLLSHGEINFRKNVSMPPVPRLRVVSNRSNPRRWVAELALPLDSMMPEPLKPGGMFFLNLLRTTSRELEPPKQGSYAVSSAVSYGALHDPLRMLRVTLAP